MFSYRAPKLIRSFVTESLDNNCQRLLKEYPNTYTFTKNIAEDLVRQCGNDLPIGVVRPAIVVSTYQEPIRAWINNFSGPAAGMVAGGLGLLRILPINPENLSNPVPVDLCVNSMIAAAWDVSNQFSKTKIDGDNFQIPIFNFESNSTNPITWRHLLDSTLENGKTNPSINTLWFPDVKYQTSNILFHILIIFYHWIPAILADGIALCFGKSPRLVDVQLKIYNNSSQLKFFTVGEWTYQSVNILNLTEKMADKDKELFFCNLRKLDWDEYLWYYPRGIRTYLVRESFDNVQDARKKIRRLYWIHQITKTIILALLLLLLWSLVLFRFY
ncbi:hypothetical protein JTB14_021203 [Gonioctena quinquepunctata]|nr:hypothetical protein JTB14_021203 [Gonioctena quinquepunctata]